VEGDQNSECVVCLENFKVGDTATRIACGHLFHEDCVKTWLASSNQCPICRYELPTDNAVYEQDRQRRMSDRRLRLHLADLSRRSVRELRHLAEHLNVDVSGCLEKGDIVQTIVGSGLVDIIPEEEPSSPNEVVASSTIQPNERDGEEALGPVITEAVEGEADTPGLEPEVVEEIECDVLPDPSPKRICLEHNATFGFEEAMSTPSPAMQDRVAQSTASTPTLTAQKLMSMRVSEVKEIMYRLGVDTRGCLEKQELIQRLMQSGYIPSEP